MKSLEADLFLCDLPVLPGLANPELRQGSSRVLVLWKPGALEEILVEENQREILAGNLALSS